jgi:hypothetical protein
VLLLAFIKIRDSEDKTASIQNLPRNKGEYAGNGRSFNNIPRLILSYSERIFSLKQFCHSHREDKLLNARLNDSLKIFNIRSCYCKYVFSVRKKRLPYNNHNLEICVLHFIGPLLLARLPLRLNLEHLLHQLHHGTSPAELVPHHLPNY